MQVLRGEDRTNESGRTALSVPLALLAIVLLVAGLALWIADGADSGSVQVLRPRADSESAGDESPGEAREAAVEPLTGMSGAPPAARPSSPVAPQARAVEASVPQAIRTFLVMVVDELGRVVPGARLESSAVPSHGSKLLVLQAAEATGEPFSPAAVEPAILKTDLGGRCRITAAGDVVLYASKEGLGTSGEWHSEKPPRLVSATDAETAAPEAAVSVRLELHPQARIEGVVLEAEDRPAPRATVLASGSSSHSGHTRPRSPQPVVTDSDGRFELLCDAPCFVNLHALTDDGRDTPARRLMLDPGESVFVELPLSEAFLVSGIVVDEAGEPMGHGHVTLGSTPNERTATAQPADGSFSFVVKEAGVSRLSVALPGFVQESKVEVALSAERPRAFVTVRMLAARTITGRVVWDDGTPVPHTMIGATATVPAGDTRSPGGGSLMDMSSDDGSFVVSEVDPRFPHAVTATTIQPALVQATLADVAPGARDIVIVLSRREAEGLSVSGVVLDDLTGHPITEYELLRGSGTRTLPDDHPLPISDPSGRFTLTGLSPFHDALAIKAVGYPPKTFGPLNASDYAEGVVIRLARLGSLTVTVVDETGAPVPGARLLAARASSDRKPDLFIDHVWARTDAAGAWRFPDLPPGRYMLQADAAGRASDLSFTEVLPEQDRMVRVIVRPDLERGKLIVRLLDEDGQPLGGLTVTANNMTTLGLHDAAGVTAESAQESDAGGEAIFASMLPGQYWVWPRVPGGFVGPRWVAVRAGAPTVVIFEGREPGE